MRRIIFCLLFMSSLICQAGVYPVFVIDKVLESSGGYEPLGHQTLKEMGALTDIVPPPGKYMWFGIKYLAGGVARLKPHASYQPLKLEAGETLGHAAQRAYAKWQVYGGMMTNVKSRSDICLAYALIDKPGGDWPLWSTAMIPPGACQSPPPFPEWCKITSGQITIDHGSINVGSDMKKISKDIVLNCSSSMTVILRLSQDSLELSPGVRSRLTLPNNGRITAVSGDNHTTITSELALSAGATPGKYQKSTVLSVNYY